MHDWSVMLVVAVTSGCSASGQAVLGSEAGVEDAALIDASDAPWESSMDGEGESQPPVDGAADGADAPAPVRIIRGDPTITTWLTLTIEGHGLTALEGRLVSVRIGMPDRPPERLGSGQARVENGAFAINFPDVWETGGIYKQKLVFIDLDGDGICTEADKTYSDYRAASEDTVLTLPGSAPPVPLLQLRELRDAAEVTAFCQLWNMPWPDV